MVNHESPDVVIDIETYQDVGEKQLAKIRANIKPDGRMTNQDKIKADVAKKESAIIDKAALSPLTGRIIAVGLGIRRGSTWEQAVFVDKLGDEGALLHTVDSVLDELVYGHLITFNGKRFDLPFLAARAMRHRMRLAHRWPLGKYHPLHIDLCDLLGSGSLDDWATAILDKPKTLSGADIAGLVKDEKWEDIKAHCLEDITLTAELFEAYEAVATLGRK
jgi:DNA polymerase elongation subunit (family B)